MTEIERIKQEGWLPKSFWKSETICDYYVSEEQKKVWAICLDLYKEFTRVCEKHNLQYWANGGTALGAVRHNGFIPWDDDMDFHMMRDDYDKLLSLKDEFKEPYFLQHPDTDPEYAFSIIKLRNSRTTAIGGKFSYAKFNHGIFLDIFPLDKVESEDDMEERNKQIFELVMYGSAMMRKNYPDKNERDLEIIKKYYIPNLSSRDLIKKINLIAASKQDVQTKYVGQVVFRNQFKSWRRMWRKEVFDGYAEMDFYGLKMRLPKFYKEYLEIHFDDYKKFPSIEDRGKWHDFYFYPEIPYIEYIEKREISYNEEKKEYKMNNKNALDFFYNMAKTAEDPLCVKLAHKSDFSDYDVAHILKYADNTTDILDVGTGTGVTVNKLYKLVNSITALEKFENFSRFIVKSPNIKIINKDIFEFEIEQKFDLITLFGFMHYFNEEESLQIYKKCQNLLKPNGKIIVKQQFGVNEDVTVTGYSEEQKTDYFSQYRHLDKEITNLRQLGYKNIEAIDIYPKECNRWNNTHFYSIVAEYGDNKNVQTCSDKTIIISCAGMGTRLGINSTKALVDIDGIPLILRQLEMLKEYDDIRIIVGYQAEKIIETVSKYRSDIKFIFNNDYKTTGTAASFSKGLVNARKFAVALDGDLLVHPDDLHNFLEQDYQCVGGCTPGTDNPVLMTIDHKGEDMFVTEFSRKKGELEWSGLAMLETEKLVAGTGHVYQMIEPLMPVKVMKIDCREIDTMNDYDNAVAWIKNNYANRRGGVQPTSIFYNKKIYLTQNSVIEAKAA